MIRDLVVVEGKEPSHYKIAVMGIAFKNNTGDCRFTPTKPAIQELVKYGFRLEIFDPWVSEEDARTVTEVSLSSEYSEALKGADCVAFFTGHAEFYQITMAEIRELAAPNVLIFDGRMFFKQEKIDEIKELGMRYKGVGR